VTTIDEEPRTAKVPRAVVRTAVSWFAVLLGVLALFELSDGFRDPLPSRLGRLPVGVAWFGGIGGSLASLTGIFWHNASWDESYNLWHKLRPATGMVMGSSHRTHA
jgi:hypothetical protein